MKIAYASDLHLEFGRKVNTDGLEEADCLVLAGDVETDPKEWADFLNFLSDRFSHRPIFIVMGNHEYYHGVFPDAIDKYRAELAKIASPNVRLLEKESFVVDGVRFLGATMWSDFANGYQAQSCNAGMADFSVITDADTGNCLSTDRILRVHKGTVEWLDDMLIQPFAGQTVVITHHAPSFRSSHPRFAGSKLTGGFCSNMDDAVEQWAPDLWIHGHVHDPLDYKIGKTRVVCNPWGYPNEGNDSKFLIVNVES